MTDNRSNRILVTGGAGFIGSHTVVELVSAGFSPVVIDNFANSEPEVLAELEKITGSPVLCIHGDCADEALVSKIISENEISGIIHFAAYKAVGESVQEPLKYYQNNIGSLISVLRAMKATGVKNLVFSSSCTVYGQPDHLPVTEFSAVKPATSPYGYTKQVCEEMLKDVCRAEHDLSVLALRYFNPIGAHPDGLIGELPRGVPNNLVPFLTQSVAGILPELVIHGTDYNTPDGSCIRDYIHVCDLAIAHVKALEKAAQSHGFQVYNLGQGRGHTVLEVITAFERATGLKVPYRIGPRRAGDVEQIWADTSKSNAELGWKTRYTIEDALSHAWNWQQNLMRRKKANLS
ncbi:MAG: hypothetical protein RL220_1595 [Bacteroidota bacterium]|jgi:UDP-glucose 4-epimerase